MRRFRFDTLRKLAQEERGDEVMEAAVILPLLFVFLMAVFWFGQAFRMYGTITQAARQGARAAVAPACTTCTAITQATAAQNAVTAVTNALNAAHLNPAQIQPPSPIPSFTACGSTQTVNSCYSTTPATNVCVEFNVQLSSTAQSGAGECGTAVSFGYQYGLKFSLPCWPQPCTPMNLSTLALPARAQMRAETQ
jgi:Flp pilus assembly protein TadG